MVTTTPTRPHSDTGASTSDRRPARTKGPFIRSNTTSRAGLHSSNPPAAQPRSHTIARIVRILKAVCLPPPAEHRPRPLGPTRFDSAASVGVWMRRRDELNP